MHHKETAFYLISIEHVLKRFFKLLLLQCKAKFRLRLIKHHNTKAYEVWRYSSTYPQQNKIYRSSCFGRGNYIRVIHWEGNYSS